MGHRRNHIETWLGSGFTEREKAELTARIEAAQTDCELKWAQVVAAFEANNTSPLWGLRAAARQYADADQALTVAIAAQENAVRAAVATGLPLSAIQEVVLPRSSGG